MKVLFAASEVWPFIKTGGLADVAYALPKALKKNNIDIRVILPKHSLINQKYLTNIKYLGHKKIWTAHHEEYVGIDEVVYDDLIFYLVDNNTYFTRPAIYGAGDDCERYTFFSKAITETFDLTGFIPDIIHCNDWQTALVPIYLKERELNNIKTIFTIHNLRFQGFFFNDVIEKVLEISRYKYYLEDGLKYYDMISFLKGGVCYSDIITTVSNTYAEEIKTPEYGEGIDGLFRKYEYKLYGILNGIDESTLKFPDKPKSVLKKELQAKLHLKVDEEIPLIAFISRLDRQKGVDLIIEKLDEIMSKDIQLIILGTGDKKYEDFFRVKEHQYKGKLISYMGFNADFSMEVYAASDLFLMPSIYEPCGISQMLAMKYGSIPIVRETGGLKDTVEAYNEYTETGDGFSFKNINADEMLKIINYALSIYKNKEKWYKIVLAAKERDNSWTSSAKKYLNLYKKLTDN